MMYQLKPGVTLHNLIERLQEIQVENDRDRRMIVNNTA